ncbi:MAG: hypothetical protein LBW85_13535 [Deltaproteobacteria bacterium]|jgi:hypothetical protein|nr:hypothetical protein [Deltaproteobacteria bacterium]
MDFLSELSGVMAELGLCAKALDAMGAGKGAAKARKAERAAAESLRSAEARLAALCAAGRPAGAGALGEALLEAVRLASRLGDLGRARACHDRLIGLPPPEGGSQGKLEAAAILAGDYFLCCDFGEAVSVLLAARRHAGGRAGAQAWLAGAARLGASLAEEGRLEEALAVYAAMRPLRRWEFSGAERARAALAIVRGLRLAGDVERAFAVFRETGSYAKGPEAFRLHMEAALSLLLELSRAPGEGRYAFLSRALNDPAEPPERSILRGEAALAFVTGRAAVGDLEEARAVLDAFCEFSGAGLAELHRVRCAAVLAEGYMDAGRLDGAWRLLESVAGPWAASGAAAREARAAALESVSAGAAGPVLSESAGADSLSLAPYGLILGAALRLAGALCAGGRGPEARVLCGLTARAAPGGRELSAFAEAALEAAEAKCKEGLALEALELWRAMPETEGPPEAYELARCRMGAAAVRGLCAKGHTDEALAACAALPAPRAPGDRLYYERLQADMDVFNALLSAGLCGPAERHLRRRADFAGPEKAAQRWLAAAERLVECYADRGSLSKARAIFRLARRRAPKAGRFILRLFAMSQELISAYCAKGDLASARELYDGLPDPGPSVRLEQEKAEIFFFLTLNYCRKGEIREALGFYRSLPDESPTGKLPYLKARTASWLIADLSGRGLPEEAAGVYESLSRLGEADGLDLVRAKSAIRLITAFTLAGDTDRALELLLAIPSFCDPARIGRQLRAAAAALSLALSERNDPEKAGALKAFTLERL